MEIIGEHLQPLFKGEKLEGKKILDGVYEIWEIPDTTYKSLCNITEETYSKYPLTTWAYADGSNMKEPNVEYIINDCPIKAWDGEQRLSWKDDECIECSDYIEGRCSANEEDILGCNSPRKYATLMDYFSYEMCVGLLSNICALAVDLAKYNNMTLSELFKRYEESWKYYENCI